MSPSLFQLSKFVIPWQKDSKLYEEKETKVKGILGKQHTILV